MFDGIKVVEQASDPGVRKQAIMDIAHQSKRGGAAASCGVRRFHKGDVVEGELVEEAARVRAEMGDEYRRVDDDNYGGGTDTASGTTAGGAEWERALALLRAMPRRALAPGIVSYSAAMARITAVTRDGEVLEGMPVFAACYDKVGYGWLFTPLRWPVVRPLVDLLYAAFAAVRTDLTRGASLRSLVEKHEDAKKRRRRDL